jgi:hypothetical protein
MTRVAPLLFLLAPAAALAQGRIQGRSGSPPVIKTDHDSGAISYRVTIRPGVPNAKDTVTVELELAQILAEPDPTFGRRKPLDEADVTAYLVGPNTADKKKPKQIIEARHVTQLPDGGTYGVSFNAEEPGIYGLYLRGTSPAGPIDHAVSISYGLWPIPEGIARPALPAKLPEASSANLDHGRALCDRVCKKDVPGALPAGATPTFLPSPFAAGLDDESLLATVVGEGAAELTNMERIDLLHYLRSLHMSIADFFPSVSAWVSNEFTINEHGVERLKENKIALADGEGTARVFVVYKGEKRAAPLIVKYSDTVKRDRLDKKDKVGYVVFLSLPGEKRGAELGIALGLEPSYPIVGARARGNDGSSDAALNKQLAAFAGLGKFNDKKSLAKGPAGLRDKLLPVYLRAAELATMYYGEEREFTAFDDAFK